jgi:multiple sugar transport system ATP-binding protein
MARGEIELLELTKRFAEVTAVDAINLEIPGGEFFSLLGPSGCGKTTTLRAIAGLEEIDNGDILIDGKPVQNLEAGDRDIAFVFQLFALYPHLTAYENIAFPLRATRESHENIDKRVRAVARAIQIEHLLNKRPSALAGGDMQRVAIGRALVRRPKAMLMDEPIGALDAKLREEMRTELKRLHIENDSTTVYVTHDQIEAMALADRIAIMNDGVLQQDGTPTDVYQRPANLFVAQFIGSPAMNVFEGTFKNDSVEALGAYWPCEVKAREGQRVAYGIRPEHLRLEPGGITGQIEVVEPMGAETEILVKVGGQTLNMMTHGRASVGPGERVSLAPQPSQAHLFDAATGRRIQ